MAAMMKKEELLNLEFLCRLCAEENANGITIFENEENDSELCTIINKYLPLKIQKDENLPNKICPGCNIQLESSVQFLNLIVKGQTILREVLKQQSLTTNNAEEQIYIQVWDDGSLYTAEHPFALEIEGNSHPKKKRGRPKKVKAPTPTPEESQAYEAQLAEESAAGENDAFNEGDSVEGRKRRRKTPQRYREAVQGKELERIFKEEGVIDESDDESKQQTNEGTAEKDDEKWKDEVIGHMESSEGNTMGQLIVVNRAKKGRGRPKGKSKSTKQTCNLCLLDFASLGRYMAHIANYHSKDDLMQVKSNNQDSLAAPTENMKGDNTFSNDTLNSEFYKDTANDSNNLDIPQEVTKPSACMPSLDVQMNHVLSDNDLLMKPDGTIQMSERLPENILAGEESVTETQETSFSTKVEKLPDSKFKCTECDKLFLSKQSCELHLKASHLKERPYKCTVCEKTFPYQITLKHHMLVHTSKVSRGYACDECGKVLNHPSSVIYHKETEHNDGRRFICIKCGKSFKHKQLLLRHQLVHSDARPFVCKICNATFKSKSSLINHQPTHTGIKRFTCDICQRQFANKASLKLHLKWHTGEKPFACSVCSKRFCQNGNLVEHMRIHTGEKPYQCNLCDRAFTTSSQHRLHLLRHRGEKPWQCTHCDKRFSNKEAWRVHLRLHTGERPFSCDQCSRRFTERWALKKHQRIHSGEKPYKCDVCSRTFADCSNLTKHKKIHLEIDSVVLPEFELNKSPALPKLNEELEDEGQQIVYVTYQATEDDDENETPTIHIINECDIVNGTNVFNPSNVNTETYMINEESMTSETGNIPMIFDQVTDADGNPLHFTTQDGTQLSITTTDGGKSLQVTTEDGQLIPVQLSDKLDDDETILKEQLILSSEIVDEEASTSDNSIRVMGPGGQAFKFLATVDDNNFSYYTFT